MNLAAVLLGYVGTTVATKSSVSSLREQIEADQGTTRRELREGAYRDFLTNIQAWDTQYTRCLNQVQVILRQYPNTPERVKAYPLGPTECADSKFKPLGEKAVQSRLYVYIYGSAEAYEAAKNVTTGLVNPFSVNPQALNSAKRYYETGYRNLLVRMCQELALRAATDKDACGEPPR